MKKIKRNKNIYDQSITNDNLYTMWKIIKRTCKNRKEVFLFSLNLNTNLHYIYYLLKNKVYQPSHYKTFMIFEPKPRLVMSQTITDKIVNHFIANYYLMPYLEKSLIDANVATRKNKGSSYAMKLLKKYYNKIIINEKPSEIYCLKIDISKYFYTIDHGILLEKLQKKILDPNVINLIKIVIEETNKNYINQSINYYNKKYNCNIPLYKDSKGLSIGAMTSQFLAIFYLNDLDHYIKEKLKCKYYIRYMDDFLILDTNKERLKEYQKLIVKEIEKLNLKVNKKSNIYKSSIGYTFLGYKYQVLNHKLRISFNKKTYWKIKKKLKRLLMTDKLLYNRTLASYNGYFLNVYRERKLSFKMKLVDKYSTYKEKYITSIVLLKEGIFYKTFYEDAKILWYLFDYKYINDTVSFGNVPYDKVLLKLNKLDISYVVIDNDGVVLSYIRDEDIYLSYESLAKKSYAKLLKTEELIEKLKQVMNEKPNSYNEINNLLDKILQRK